MGMKNLFPFFGRDKEKEALELFVQHVTRTREAMSFFIGLNDAVANNKFDEVARKKQEIKDKERECDQIRHHIYTTLFEGAFLPVMRSQLHKLSDNIDAVTDAIDNASSMALYFKVHKLNPEAKSILQRLVSEAEKSVSMLEEMLHSLLSQESNDVFSDKYRRMKITEESCDQIQKELFDHLYYAKKVDAVLVSLAGRYGHTISTIADHVEAASDTMAAIKMLRQA